MAKCRSCGAEIEWIKTTNGKSMPVDAAPDEGRGNIVVTFGIGKVLSGESLSEAAMAKIPLHTSHFSTCPNANQHRKPK